MVDDDTLMHTRTISADEMRSISIYVCERLGFDPNHVTDINIGNRGIEVVGHHYTLGSKTTGRAGDGRLAGGFAKWHHLIEVVDEATQ